MFRILIATLLVFSSRAQAGGKAQDWSAGGLENLREAAPDLYSGGEPRGAEGFASLAQLGVRTIISVDGGRPDIAGADSIGARYVHIPIGYDGVESSAARAVALALRDLEGPVYVHCHHGLHRGPTMVAIAMRVLGRWDSAEAITFMRDAGTSDSYGGLFASVREVDLSPDDLSGADAAELPSVAVVSGMAANMAQIDRVWDRLRLLEQNEWRQLEDHPDLAPAASAGELADLFRILQSDEEVQGFPPDLRAGMVRAGELASRLETLLDAAEPPKSGATELIGRIRNECRSCHDRHRDARD